MDIYETNLARLREFELDTIRETIFAANTIASTAEELDVALCRAEEQRVPTDKLYDARGERVDTSILKEISRGCRKADDAAPHMDIGELIGHLIFCSRELAQYAEAIEEELES